MRIRRTFPIVLSVLIVAGAIAVAVQLRKHAPPEPARLLPSADGFLYVDYSWVRKSHGKPFNPVVHDPEYEQFIQETGFDYERDLDSVAFAIHYPESWPGPSTSSVESPMRPSSPTPKCGAGMPLTGPIPWAKWH